MERDLMTGDSGWVIRVAGVADMGALEQALYQNALPLSALRAKGARLL